MKPLAVKFIGTGYRRVVKPIFFRFDPEVVHERITATGERMGNSRVAKKILSSITTYRDPILAQRIAGIDFATPIGLAAGFDYQGRLTQILPSLGFGFGTIGSITREAHPGNPRPILGRLPKSQSLMVNKGFRNLGATAMVKNLSPLHFAIPIGISIGRTNRDLSIAESIADIVASLRAFEESTLEHSHYELNISCPNLVGTASFYHAQQLEKLLAAIDALHIKKPIFVKMPINESDDTVLQILDVIAKHHLAGVVLGNLQKDRTDPAFHRDEVNKFPTGGFSGKPTERRSNELIALAYKNFGDKLIIVGCGGVFSAHDAYTKIANGASLVQMITGLIYRGPQVVAEINAGLAKLLRQHNFTSIRDAIGSALH